MSTKGRRMVRSTDAAMDARVGVIRKAMLALDRPVTTKELSVITGINAQAVRWALLLNPDVFISNRAKSPYLWRLR